MGDRFHGARFSQSARELSVPPKMFQRPLSAMAASINDLDHSGDFFYRSEPEATARRFADWHKQAMIGDLASVAANWFRKSPKQMSPSLSVTERNGKGADGAAFRRALVGAW